ncbi:MAG: alpha/beta hydrolase domain-containing protein [Caulobacterales bacterium]
MPQTKVTGPITNGKGWPFGAPNAADVEARGYLMEEYFIEGVANSYRDASGKGQREDSSWDAEIDRTEPYKTRFFVIRPKDASTFNGIVLVNWQNVTAGVDLGWPQDDEIYRGYAWVGVTAQKIGVLGRPGITKGLTEWDPVRYGSLTHPGDAFSYDIFTQASRAVSADRSGSPDPLGGLKPKLMIAQGGSQSAMRLGSYINVVHQKERLFDGFFLTVHWGMCPPLQELSIVKQMVALEGGRFQTTSKINDTSGTPILALCSESETLHNYPARQPDTNTFRFWEMAGSSHSGPEMADGMADIFARDGVERAPQRETRNSVQWGYVREAALRRLVEWVRDGKAPPIMPLVEVEGGAKPKIKKDKLGNALGGIRLPEVEAPTASNRGDYGANMLEGLSGETLRFDAAKLKELYPTKADYVAKWNKAVDTLIAQGLVLPESEAAVRERAEAFYY